MSIPQEQQEKLIAYFEGKLSAEDEIRFLHEVAGDEDLQKEFDWELLLRYPQFSKLNEWDKQDQPEAFESADVHISRVTEAWKQAGAHEPRQDKPVIRFSKPMAAAALFILAIGASLVYLLYFKKQSPAFVHHSEPVKQAPGRIEKKENSPAPENEDRLLADNTEKAERVYAQYYKKYTGSDEDPIEASKFLYAYHAGRYDEVVKGAAEELSSKGVNTNTAVLKTYLNFYQGISYLHIKKKNGLAITKFQEVLRQASPKDHVYYDASWYLAMAYMQQGNIQNAKPFLQQLAAGTMNSGYKRKAAEVLKML